ncbi:MAG: O-antigen polymerase [Pseudomonadota bacterium]
MKPLWFIWCVVGVFAIAGFPVAALIDQDGIFHALTARVAPRFVNLAYLWTCISFAIVLIVAMLCRAHRNHDKFLSKPLPQQRKGYYFHAWLLLTGSSLLVSTYLFIATGFRLPLLNLLADPTSYLLLRTEARANISQTLLNINLVFLCPLSICLAAFFIERGRFLKVLIAIVNTLLAASFSLAKSPIAMALLVVIVFYAFLRPIPIFKLGRYGFLMLAVMIPLFMASGSGREDWSGERSVVEILGGRIFYGQWAGLPYFFKIFEKDRVSIGTLQPRYLRSGEGGSWSHRGEELPARQAMREITGYRDLESAGVGVAVTYFIGEAYAVWGEFGIVLASVLVGLQIALLASVFARLPRTVWTMFLYAWFIYKMTMGMITGASAFLFSATTYLLLLIALITYLTHVAREIAQADTSDRASCA